MQKGIDWLELWRELSEVQEEAWRAGGAKDREDVWLARAEKFNAEVKRRWSTPDSSRDFVTAQLRANPGWTALDIGGGTGAWAALMAQSARHVTVVEPSSAMIAVMRKNLAAAAIKNVEIVQQKWPEAQVDTHDLTLCAHAMYGFADFAAFVHSIEAITRHICVLILRAPIPEDLLSVAAMRIWGHPYDSPDFQVAYNALIQMGIFPNVLMEDTGLWDPWISPSMEEAFAETKRKLNLITVNDHDAYLHDLLGHNLIYRDGGYVWPRGIRTALVYWNVASQSRF
jgi:SAM-dependent methyltransferase